MINNKQLMNRIRHRYMIDGAKQKKFQLIFALRVNLLIKRIFKIQFYDWSFQILRICNPGKRCKKSFKVSIQ